MTADSEASKDPWEEWQSETTVPGDARDGATGRQDQMSVRAAREDVAELLNELTHLPRAIAQTAAYLNVIQISLREYLSLLKHAEKDTISLLSREFRDETRYRGSGLANNAVARTWLISFNYIRRSDPVAADQLLFM